MATLALLGVVAAARAGVTDTRTDWQGVPPSMADGRGDGTITADGIYHAGGDLLGLWIKNTPCTVYFRVDLAGSPDTSLNLFLDTDQNELTGCSEYHGAEYLLRVVQIPGVIAPEVQFLDWTACSPGTTGNLSVASFGIGRDGVELSVPVVALQSLTPDTQGFTVHVSAGLIGDTSPDFLLPPIGYEASPQFSDRCSERPETPGRGGSIHLGGTVLPPPSPF